MRRSRVVAAVAVAIVIVLGMAATGAPAAALPAPPHSAWWYTELDLQRAWRISQGAGVTVAVVDSGVKASLGDLAGQVLRGKDYTGGSRDGRVDLGPKDNPLFGHGTQMALYIAGTGRGGGLIGVAPKAKILPVRVGDGRRLRHVIAPAIRWAVAHGAQVVNLSLGSSQPCTSALQAAVDDAVRHDVIVVAATGDTAGAVQSPADCTGVVAVGGLADTAAFRPWAGEAFGPQLDFVAPAEKLTGEYLNGRVGPPAGVGDSAAAAFVSGTFALLRSRFPHDTDRQLVARALYGVHNGPGVDFGRRIDDRLGYGEILPFYALTTALPRHPRNPLWNAVDRHVATSDPPTRPVHPSSAGSSAPRPSRSSGGSTSAAASGTSSGSGATALIAGVVAAVVLAALGVALLARRRARRG